MAIIVDNDTRLVVQGLTGREGSFHSRQMIEYGTEVVAGVTPGKGGQMFEGKVPIFNTVAEAVRAAGANTSVIYVPPMGAAAAQAKDQLVTVLNRHASRASILIRQHPSARPPADGYRGGEGRLGRSDRRRGSLPRREVVLRLPNDPVGRRERPPWTRPRWRPCSGVISSRTVPVSP